MSKFQACEAGSVDKMETQRRNSLGKEVSSVLDMWSLRCSWDRQWKLSNKNLFVLQVRRKIWARYSFGKMGAMLFICKMGIAIYQ